MKSSLSVVLATFNEEKNLDACLSSLNDIADEIVIVDGSSSDKTVEIARKYNSRIKITTNKPNFHINKQMAIDMAKKDWILQMDADEIVSDELKKEIKEVIKNDSGEYNGFWMPRKNFFLGRFLLEGGQYPDYTLRFYRNGKGRLPQKDVHEQTVVDGKVGYLKNALLHYPYKKFSNYLSKWNRYNNLFSDQIKKEQNNKNLFEKIFYSFAYLLLKPTHWFLTTYFRHKGFMDSWQGFIFSLFSALRFPVSYIKYLGTYKLLFFLIIILASFIRFYNFPSRWALGGDEARDALIALEALKRHEIPLMGSFSSAGPFVFGGIYYWFIIFSYLIFPFWIFSPWLILALFSVITVIIFGYLGKILIGERFSLIIALLAATSPQLVIRSLQLGQHTFIVTFSAIALIFLILLWNRKKIIYSLFLGLFIGLSISFHYQALNLLILIPTILFIRGLNNVEKIQSIILSIFGVFLPLIPLLYWDYHQNFANIRNIMDYFLLGQYRIYVPNSWKIFLTQSIPSFWSFVSGNYYFLGLMLFFSSNLVFIYSFIKKKIDLKFVVLGFTFLTLLFINKFYKGERSEGYLLYLTPFVLIFSALFFDEMLKFREKFFKLITIMIFATVIVGNFISIKGMLNYRNFVDQLNIVYENLNKKFPNTKFSIYDFTYKFSGTSHPLSLYLEFKNKSDINGRKIGLSCYGINCPSVELPIINKDHILLVDLGKVDQSDFEKNKKIWINVNQKSVYEGLIGWLNKNQLKSNFFLDKYLKDNLLK